MTLLELTRRRAVPEPWTEGTKIPWNDPAFSGRMLREHLSPDHDMASPRGEKIDRHVAWIHAELLGGEDARILDLGCGPGLYTQRLARLGHPCVGVDFSPASVAYARAQAEAEGLPCTYLEQDLRDGGELGEGFGLAMMLEGEINAFRRSEARDILTRARQALVPGGRLLLAASALSAFEQDEPVVRAWHTEMSGLFCEGPHLYLTETFWDGARRTHTTRYLIVDAASGEVTAYAHSNQGYDRQEYAHLLTECGFGALRLLPPLHGMDHPYYNVVMTAQAGAA